MRARKATPVLLTPVMRRRFDKEGNLQDTHGEYPEIVRCVAGKYKVALIDMQRSSAAVLAKYGAEESRKLFLQLKPNEKSNYPNGIEDNTHFNPLGAEIMAGLAADGIHEQRLPIARFMTTRKTLQEIAR